MGLSKKLCRCLRKDRDLCTEAGKMTQVPSEQNIHAALQGATSEQCVVNRSASQSG